MNLRNSFDKAMRTTSANSQYEGTLGKPIAEGEYESGPDEDNPFLMYVVLTQGEGMTIIEAYNTRVPYQPGLAVLVEKDKDDAWIVVGTDTSRAITQMGDLGQTTSVAPHSHQVGGGLDDPVEGKRFIPGAVFWQTAFTFYIEPFWYQYFDEKKRFPGGTVDISDSVPGTNRHRFVVIGIDPVTNTASYVKGTQYSLAYALTEDKLTEITTSLVNLMGVILQDGDTDAGDYERFYDMRQHFDVHDGIGSLDVYYTPINQNTAMIATENNAGTVSLATQNTWYQLTQFNEDNISRGATADSANDHILILESGYYIILFTASFELDTASKTVQFAIFENNGARRQHGALIEEEYPSANKQQLISMSVVAYLTAGDTVEVWARYTNAGASPTLTLKHGNLIVTGAN